MNLHQKACAGPPPIEGRKPLQEAHTKKAASKLPRKSA